MDGYLGTPYNGTKLSVFNRFQGLLMVIKSAVLLEISVIFLLSKFTFKTEFP